MKKVSSKKRTDYHAMLTIYGLGLMKKSRTKQIGKWLCRIGSELKREDPKIFTKKRFIARYMK